MQQDAEIQYSGHLAEFMWWGQLNNKDPLQCHFGNDQLVFTTKLWNLFFFVLIIFPEQIW
jgi:hypothetical protein